MNKMLKNNLNIEVSASNELNWGGKQKQQSIFYIKRNIQKKYIYQYINNVKEKDT